MKIKYITGICFTADGNLVVADQYNNRVQIVGEDGAFVRKFGSRGKRKGQFDRPFDVSVGPDGSIAVLDSGNGRVQVFDGMGVFVRSFGSYGKGPGQFVHPAGIAVGAGGEIIVADLERKDVQVFSKEGELLQIIGAEGDSDVDFKFPAVSVCAEADGRLTALLRVKRVARDGVTLGEVEVVTLT